MRPTGADAAHASLRPRRSSAERRRRWPSASPSSPRRAAIGRGRPALLGWIVGQRSCNTFLHAHHLVDEPDDRRLLPLQRRWRLSLPREPAAHASGNDDRGWSSPASASLITLLKLLDLLPGITIRIDELLFPPRIGDEPHGAEHGRRRSLLLALSLLLLERRPRPGFGPSTLLASAAGARACWR